MGTALIRGLTNVDERRRKRSPSKEYRLPRGKAWQQRRWQLVAVFAPVSPQSPEDHSGEHADDDVDDLGRHK